MVMYVTLELPLHTMYIKSKMCKYIYLHHLLHLWPVLRLNLFYSFWNFWRLCSVLWPHSVLEGLNWQLWFLFWFGFFLTCQLHDNINSELGKAVRRLAYIGDLFYLLWSVALYLFINMS